MAKARFGKTKKGQAYPKDKGKASTDHRVKHKGMSIATLRKIKKVNARRKKIARLTDNGKKARIDPTGEKWLHNPNRYDVVGVDAKVTIKKK